MDSSGRKSEVCVIIPAFNEENNIKTVLSKILARGLDVLVIDDGSKDRTPGILKSMGISVITHDKNRGKGISLREGFGYSVQKGYSAVITMDADGQHNPEEVDAFINAYRRNPGSIVLGNRMAKPDCMPALRILTNRFMSGLISVLTGTDIPDSQCGYRLIPVPVLKKIDFVSKNYDIETELLIRAGIMKISMVNVPVSSIYNRDQQSYINPFVDTLRFVRIVFRAFFSAGRRGS